MERFHCDSYETEETSIQAERFSSFSPNKTKKGNVKSFSSPRFAMDFPNDSFETEDDFSRSPRRSIYRSAKACTSPRFVNDSPQHSFDSDDSSSISEPFLSSTPRKANSKSFSSPRFASDFRLMSFDSDTNSVAYSAMSFTSAISSVQKNIPKGSTSSVLQSIKNMLQCSTDNTVDEISPKVKKGTRRNHDMKSQESFTICTEDLESSFEVESDNDSSPHNSLGTEQKREQVEKVESVTGRKFLPAAFGGDGLCMSHAGRLILKEEREALEEEKKKKQEREQATIMEAMKARARNIEKKLERDAISQQLKIKKERELMKRKKEEVKAMEERARKMKMTAEREMEEKLAREIEQKLILQIEAKANERAKVLAAKKFTEHVANNYDRNEDFGDHNNHSRYDCPKGFDSPSRYDCASPSSTNFFSVEDEITKPPNPIDGKEYFA